MADERIRRQIAFLAAQMMYRRTESEYFTAKRKAAKQLGVEYRHRPGDLPSNKEIRDQIQAMARMHEGPKRLEHLRDMRLDALRFMQAAGAVPAPADRQRPDRARPQGLRHRHPRLLRQPRAGHRHARRAGLQYDVELKRIVKHNEERVFTHIHVFDRNNFELTLYPEDKAHYVFKSSITGKAIERASIAELEALLRRGIPGPRPRHRGRAPGGARSTPSCSTGCCSSRWRA